MNQRLSRPSKTQKCRTFFALPFNLSALVQDSEVCGVVLTKRKIGVVVHHEGTVNTSSVSHCDGTKESAIPCLSLDVERIVLA
jgi:hypothetical protein